MEGKPVTGVVTPVCTGYSMIRVMFPLGVLPAESPKQTHAIMVIDVSGSMSGSQLGQAKEALTAAVGNFQQFAVPVTILAFNNNVVSVSCDGSNYAPVLNFLKDLNAMGGTIFRNVLVSLLTEVQTHPECNYYITFFTDGCDNEPYEKLLPHLQALQKYVQEKDVVLALHTIGFGSGHDAGLLNKLVTFGTKEGTFQYVTSAAEIPVAVGKLAAYVDFANFWGELSLGPEHSIRLNFQKEADGSYIALAYTTDKDLALALVPAAASYVVIHKGKESYKLGINMEKQSTPTDVTLRVGPFSELVTRKIIALTQRLTQGTPKPEELNQQNEEVTRLRTELSQMMQLVMKSKGLNKMDAVEQLKRCRDMFTAYYVAFNEAATKGAVTNVSLAQLNNVAYKGVIDARVAREMAKRTAIGKQVVERMGGEIEEAKNRLNFPELRSKYPKLVEEFGHCAISIKNWIEALEEGDCLCLTYDAERSLEDIFDASTVRIKGINTSLLTTESFVSAALFLSNSQEGVKLAEFGSSQNLANALPNETVNGVLPLYICEEHWQIAKLKMRPMNAWTDTHDIMAMSQHQPVRIPFLVLIKAADTATTAFKKQQLHWILETCLAQYKVPEYRELILTDCKEVFANYLTAPQYRTTEFIKSIPIFVAHFCFALLHDDAKVADFDLFLRCVLEELFRRASPEASADKEARLKYLFEILQNDGATVAKKLADIDVGRRKFTMQGDPSEQFVAQLKAKGVALDPRYLTTPSEESKELQQLAKEEQTLLGAVSMPLKLDKVGAETRKLCDKYEALLGQECSEAISVHNLVSVLMKRGTRYSSLKSMGLEESAQLTLLVLQNVMQATNANRRMAVKAGNYTSPFDPSEKIAKQLQKFYADAILELKECLVAKELKQNIKTIKTEAEAQRFAATPNPYIAAGLIMGTSKPAEFRLFLTALLKGTYPCLWEKLSMVLNGEYLGVQLVDQIAVCIKKYERDVRSLIFNHYLRLKKEEWLALGNVAKDIILDAIGRAKKSTQYGHPPLPS